MIPDYKSNAVYMSVWLERDYNEVYTAFISVPLKSRQININQTIPEKGKN